MVLQPRPQLAHFAAAVPRISSQQEGHQTLLHGLEGDGVQLLDVVVGQVEVLEALEWSEGPRVDGSDPVVLEKQALQATTMPEGGLLEFRQHVPRRVQHLGAPSIMKNMRQPHRHKNTHTFFFSEKYFVLLFFAILSKSTFKEITSLFCT